MNEQGLTRFVFDANLGAKNLKEIDNRIKSINDRIDHLSEKTMIGPFKVMSEIIRLSKDPRQIAILGKALVRVAPSLQELKELEKQKSVIDMAIEKPEWIAATFADFDEDIDSMVDLFFEED